MQNWQQQALKSEQAIKDVIQSAYERACMEIGYVNLATLWYRWTQDDKGVWSWEFNHLEDGHCPNPVPTPKCESHSSVWKGGKWAKSYIQLVGNKVSHLLY